MEGHNGEANKGNSLNPSLPPSSIINKPSLSPHDAGGVSLLLLFIRIPRDAIEI